MNQIDLNNRIAVVTGAARGIGYAVASKLLDSGARVALWDRDGAALDTAVSALRTRGKVIGVVVDVADEAAIAMAAATTRRELGEVDILVNNAGITGPNVPSWEYPASEFRRVLEVDLVSVLLCSQAFLPGMRARGYGRIVNVASVAGKEGNPNAVAYSAAKAGVIALTKSMSKELATQGVLVNCVTPAAAATDIFKQMTQAHIDYMLSKIPMGRFIAPDEIAAMVAWLCSAECSFSTGAVFDLSGGRATY